jgi:hypothetical protein
MVLRTADVLQATVAASHGVAGTEVILSLSLPTVGPGLGRLGPLNALNQMTMPYA